MKVTVCMIVVAFVFGWLFEVAAKDSSAEMLVFEGTVLRIGRSPGFVSGDVAAYQLVKYRVEKVCKGSYAEKEIVVDHLILTGKELTGISVDDKVRVTVERAKSINACWNEPGIRASSDEVKEFYIGQKVVAAQSAPCVSR